jgi:hypothetical protein
MYVKVRLTSERKIIDYCFMKSEVEAEELKQKISELTLKFNKDDILTLSVGY